MAFVHEFLFELIRQRHSRGLIVVSLLLSLATVALMQLQIYMVPVVALVHDFLFELLVVSLTTVSESFYIIQLNHQPNLVRA